jgi:hypothetical protein
VEGGCCDDEIGRSLTDGRILERADRDRERLLLVCGLEVPGKRRPRLDGVHPRATLQELCSRLAWSRADLDHECPRPEPTPLGEHVEYDGGVAGAACCIARRVEVERLRELAQPEIVLATSCR